MRTIFTTLAIFGVLGLGTITQAQSTVGDHDQDDQAKQTQKTPNVKLTHGPVVESVKDTTAVIAWSTNVNASTIVKYGTDKDNLNLTTEMPWGGVTHRVHLKGLKPNTTYYFQAKSSQGQGTGSSAVSNVENFKTIGQK